MYLKNDIIHFAIFITLKCVAKIRKLCLVVIMEIIDNINKTLKDDLSVEIKEGSKLSIAAACFSIYAFQELKEQLSDIEELRFIFTSPTFTTEKAKKEKREFYIPRLNRERSLYGTDFEVKLRNELSQKAIAKECAEWVKQKATFKSNVTNVDALHAANFINEEQTTQLIEKVASLGGIYKAQEISSIDVQFNTHKHSNKSTYYNVETIAKAIKEKKKIEFLAFDLNYKGEKVYRHHKKKYIEEPISLIHNEDNYYVVIWRSDRGTFSRRIDRLTEVSASFEDISPEASEKMEEINNFSSKVFKMYGGKPVTVTLDFKKEVMGSIHDKFGEQVQIEKKQTCHNDRFYDYYQVKVDVEISPTFWGWFNTFAGNMRISGPQWVIDEFNNRKLLENTISFG